MPDHVSSPETPGFSPGSGFISDFLDNFKDMAEQHYRSELNIYIKDNDFNC